MENAWPLFLRQLSSADLEFTYDDVCAWTAGEFDALTSVCLIGEMAPATHVSCDACPEAHWERVRWSEDGKRAFIPCPLAGTVDVNLERLRRWKIDARRLAFVLADALELRREPQPLAAVGGLWCLGRRRFGGRFRDLFLSVSPEEELPAVIREVQQQLSSGTGLLIAPTDARVDSGWEPSRVKVVVLSDIATWGDGKIALDLDFIEDIWGRDGTEGRKSSVRSLSVPDGTGWQDLLIEVADTLLRIEIDGHRKEVGFAEAGFSERDQRLETLKLLAAGRGQLIPGRVPKAFQGKTPIKNRVNTLRQLLQALIPIDGNPIEHNKRAGLYECKFRVRLVGDSSFPTPPGASWLDFRFVERGDGRLAVTVSEKKVFRAHEVERATGRRTEEVAQREEPATRLFSLEELGLRDSRGRLTAEGTVLVELLRGGGRLNRRGDDVAVLKLAAWLRNWTGLEGEPLQYADRNQVWTACSECASEQPE